MPEAKTKFRIWTIAIGLLAALAVYLALPFFLPPELPGHSSEDQFNSDRQRIMMPDRLIRTMGIKPGMTIVDIGAGHGFFTFPLADAVGEEGKVFATEIGDVYLHSIASRARQLGIKNVYPTRVQQVGVDAFYTRHKFDIVFLCDTIFQIPDVTGFFQQLRPSLNLDGRLWVLMARLDADFGVPEFHDLDTTLRSLASTPILSKRLSEETRATLASHSLDADAEAVRQRLVLELNRILDDFTLWPEVEQAARQNEMHLSERENELRNMVAVQLNSNGVFQNEGDLPKEIPLSMRQMLRFLNRLVIQDLLKTNVWERANSLDQFTAANWRILLKHVGSEPATVAAICDAGFELVKEHSIISCHRVWEFRSAEPSTIDRQ